MLALNFTWKSLKLSSCSLFALRAEAVSDRPPVSTHFPGTVDTTVPVFTHFYKEGQGDRLARAEVTRVAHGKAVSTDRLASASA